MTAAEIDNIARTKGYLPDEANLFDAALYSALKTVYQRFDEGMLNAEAARVVKARYVQEYEQNCLQYRINQQQARKMVQINQLLDAAERDEDARVRYYGKEIKRVLYGIGGETDV